MRGECDCSEKVSMERFQPPLDFQLFKDYRMRATAVSMESSRNSCVPRGFAPQFLGGATNRKGLAEELSLSVCNRGYELGVTNLPPGGTDLASWRSAGKMNLQNQSARFRECTRVTVGVDLEGMPIQK